MKDSLCEYKYTILLPWCIVSMSNLGNMYSKSCKIYFYENILFCDINMVVAYLNSLDSGHHHQLHNLQLVQLLKKRINK